MTIAEGMCSPSVKVASKFPQVLSLSIETLLMLCNDDESDVRMVADETLNKIIRVQILYFIIFYSSYNNVTNVLPNSFFIH